MKKFLALTLALLLALSLLTACGGKDDTADDTITTPGTAGTDDPENELDTPDADADDEVADTLPDAGEPDGSEIPAEPDMETPAGTPDESIDAPIDAPATMPDDGMDDFDDEPYYGDGFVEPDAELCEILDAIYGASDPGYGSLETVGVDLNDAYRVSYYTGLSDSAVFDAVIASEPMMSSQAYSMVIARVAEGQDAEAVAREIMNSVNTAKWVCVSADDMSACVSGQIVMFVMVDEYNTEIHSAQFAEAFNTLYSGTSVSK